MVYRETVCYGSGFKIQALEIVPTVCTIATEPFSSSFNGAQGDESELRPCEGNSRYDPDAYCCVHGIS